MKRNFPLHFRLSLLNVNRKKNFEFYSPVSRSNSLREENYSSFLSEEILLILDSTTTSDLLQTYFKFHSRSGCIDESLIIERLLSLQPKSSDDLQIKFLLELLNETLKSFHINAEQGVRFATNLNRLAKWLCQALSIYSNDLLIGDHSMIIVVSDFFLLLFTTPTFYCFWLMIIKSSKEQTLWKQYQTELEQMHKRISNTTNNRPEVFERILFK